MDGNEFDEYAVQMDHVQIGHLLLCAAKRGEKERAKENSKFEVTSQER